jgi:nucleoside-diphosphate-sugar epimerase
MSNQSNNNQLLKIFVTGATGFVGSHLCDKLRSQGHEVYALVRNEKKLEMLNCDVHVVKGSLASKNSNDWVKQLPEDLDVVYHLAGIVHHFESEEFDRINFQATKILVNDLLKKFYYSEKNPKFVFLSSLAAAGPASIENEMINETHKPSPVSAYGKSKLDCEEYLKQTLPENWQLKILRPPMVMGPRDPAVLDVFKMVKQGFVPVVGHNGHENRYSFVSVFDLIDILIATLYQDRTTQVKIYFTSHPQTVSFEDIVNAIQATQNKRRVRFIHFPFLFLKFFSMVASFLSKFTTVEIRITPDKLKELKASRWTCDGSLVSADLEFEYQNDLNSIVKLTQKDYENRGWL